MGWERKSARNKCSMRVSVCVRVRVCISEMKHCDIFNVLSFYPKEKERFFKNKQKKEKKRTYRRVITHTNIYIIVCVSSFLPPGKKIRTATKYIESFGVNCTCSNVWRLLRIPLIVKNTKPADPQDENDDWQCRHNVDG